MNDYTGPTVITAGTVSVTNLSNGGQPSAIGKSSSAPANLVLAGGTLSYSGPATSTVRGYAVQGSDQAESANVKRLAALGIRTFVGHRGENIGDAAVIVISSAVKSDNPEVIAARARLTPVIRRAEMLGELMRLKWAIAVGGTHGKTTTTSMVAHLLETAGWDP